MRPWPIVSALCLALIGGTLVTGHAILVPLVATPSTLADPNLAQALSAPLALRCADIVLVGALALVFAIPRFATNRLATTAALALLGTAAVERMVLLPRLSSAWSRVDRVTMRPVDLLEQAEQYQGHHMIMVATMIALTLGLAWLAFGPALVQMSSRARTPKAAPAEPSASPSTPEAGATIPAAG